MTPAQLALQKLDARDHAFWSRRLRWSVIAIVVIAFYVGSWLLAKVDPEKLLVGLPKLGHWLTQAWPPK